MNTANAIVWGLAWTLVTAVLFVLPLLPAFAELTKRRDIAPLAIDDADNGETDYRIKTLAPQLPELATLEHAQSWLQGDTYVLPGGAYVPMARTDRAVHMASNAAADVLISGHILEMEAGSQVRHLVHAASIVSHGAVLLNGRASADSLVVLAGGTHAFRVAAPCIVTAPLSAAPAATAPEDGPTPLTRLPERHAGDLTIEAGELRTTDLVVAGNVRLGEGARVVGHVKAHGDIDLAPGACVIGALFAGGNIRCHGSNRVQGPISAAWRVELGAHSQAGSRTVPCSVSGWDVVLGHSVAVFGAIASVGGCQVAEAS